ncbi:MAG TPA: hypothetical protein VHC49_05390 [Mycobacteriales bacterium]|nr:hypothetical protein [Mycobacteriales bacterium]
MTSKAGKRKAAAGKRPAARPTKAAGRPDGRVAGWSARQVVVGRVSPLARTAGALAAVAALGLAVRPFLPLARRTDGGALGTTAGLLGLLAWLPAIVLLGAAAYCCLRGVLPRLGLTVIGASGAVSIGVLLRAIWLLDTDGRSVLDLPVGGQALRGESYDVGAGLILELVVAAVLIAALLCVLGGWTGTVMEDGGAFERFRPAFGVIGLFLGVFAAVSFSLNSSDSPVGIAPETVTGQAGLDRIGGLILAAVVVICCIVASTVRPWLASIGTFLGLFGMLFGLAVENCVVVGRSADLTMSFGAGSQLAAAVLVLAAGLIAGALTSRTENDIPATPAPKRPQAAKNKKRARVGG